ncbi:hypothetical protein PILCRDRAFT_817295 [Piloderma croceum F 1598]|uniref:Uncharacterized protein n=1 Tax=Piloderma croceum (strain F 1598) TaxID=765440 RepID=A0A0C3FMH6_PILCF|nr:hypothetical protein PILCRDRAFT_817295 [Piloderma croceum F 1598]
MNSGRATTRSRIGLDDFECRGMILKISGKVLWNNYFRYLYHKRALSWLCHEREATSEQ